MDVTDGIAAADNISLAKKNLLDSIYRQARLEGVSVGREQVREICAGRPCRDLPADANAKIINLHNAWQFVFETVGYPVDLRYIRQINWEVGKGVVANAGDLRSTPVSMGGTAWRPELPDRDRAEARIAAIRDSEATVEDRAIDMMLYLMRAQLFADGNKRVAQLVANQMLISAGRGVLSVLVEDIDEFLRLLVRFYETNAPEKIKAFIRQNCLTC